MKYVIMTVNKKIDEWKELPYRFDNVQECREFWEAYSSDPEVVPVFKMVMA